MYISTSHDTQNSPWKLPRGIGYSILVDVLKFLSWGPVVGDKDWYLVQCDSVITISGENF